MGEEFPHKPAGKPPLASAVEMMHLVLPNHANQLGNVLGGQLMQWMDIAAALAAMRHAGKVCVTAAVDSISFLEPIRIGHIVHIFATVNRAFRTSMEVGVKVFREDPINGTRTHAASAYLTFVAIDQYGKPLPVPPVEPQTLEEQRRWQEAEFRRQQRLQQREYLRQLRQQHAADVSQASEELR
ncbi:MAG: acyl-CoA thioesterase [Candidatus Kapabacteria bacterium]|nr:acyl-CoA thioesterase [Candidatus Kapabacteria bacterium]MCS7169452.1 acyl-CoA thioesterase [Candidatus Kapabacteria bacterium]MDW7996319.1 acyl-CoA thioesterase [Bacteroidota bacterium]MDW8225550.1 acyl-CoA thioesterase [Bacteroidota bacterium]